MDELMLAVVPADTPLNTALARIRSGTRALVVRSAEGFPLLLTAGDIMVALNDAVDNNADPSDIQIGAVIPAHVPAAAPMQSPGRPSAFSFGATAVAVAPILKSGYDAIFEDSDDRYAIHELRGDTAVVITASKRFALDLNSAITICRCDGHPQHVFEPGQIVKSGICNKPHGASVTCTRL
jgi:hypothetical protein